MKRVLLTLIVPAASFLQRLDSLSPEVSAAWTENQ
jgi:hypothetical protein